MKIKERNEFKRDMRTPCPMQTDRIDRWYRDRKAAMVMTCDVPVNSTIVQNTPVSTRAARNEARTGIWRCDGADAAGVHTDPRYRSIMRTTEATVAPATTMAKMKLSASGAATQSALSPPLSPVTVRTACQ